MRKNFGPKPCMYPMPVLILGTYDENGKANAMNAAWGGICDTDKIWISLSGGHKTTQNIIHNKAFTVSFATVETLASCDYVGIISGNKETNKMEKAGFTTMKSELVNAPMIEQLPLTLECELFELMPDEKDYLVKGKIVNVSADSSILTEGNIDLTKFHPISYDPMNHTYVTVKDVVGKAFHDGKALK